MEINEREDVVDYKGLMSSLSGELGLGEFYDFAISILSRHP
jgi:hypothetical protein